METITDFEAWLDEADPEGHEEVYALYRAIIDDEPFGAYECNASSDGTKWFVKGGHTEDTLMLASEKAKNAFLVRVQEKYCDEGLDIESWYSFMRNMAKDD